MAPSIRPVALLCLVALLVGVLGTARASAGTPLDAEEVKMILRTTTVEEEGFIEQIVEKVDNGSLPRDLFESCYLWARKKPRHRFQYFKHALIERAAAAGIQL